MKTPYLVATIAATTAFAGPFLASAQEQPDLNRSRATIRSDATAPMASGGIGSMHRVSKDSVKDRITAKDLIGAAVYDSAGEKIGDIADIDLHGSLPANLRNAFGAGGSPVVADRPASGALPTTPRPGSTPAASDRPMTPRSGGTNAAQNPTMGTAHPGAAMSSGEATVYISVGGLMGIGDDLVSVPASQLSYSTTDERFQLAVAKSAVVALAENKAAPYSSTPNAAGSSAAGSSNVRDRSTTSTPNATPNAAGSSNIPDRSTTTAGKQSFDDEVSRVQNALRTEASTSALAAKVTVYTSDDQIVLSGSVESQDQKDKILSAARKATAKPVKDQIKIGNL